MVSDGRYGVYFHHLEELDQVATELYGNETSDSQDKPAKKLHLDEQFATGTCSGKSSNLFVFILSTNLKF